MTKKKLTRTEIKEALQPFKDWIDPPLVPLTVQPIENRVVILPDKEDEITKAGIILPHGSQEKPVRGTVLAVGPGNPGYPMMVKVLDRVLYGTYSGSEIQLEGKTYLVMRESDIYLIL